MFESFVFHNFKADTGVHVKANNFLENVMDCVPTDSSIDAKIIKLKKRFRCEIDIKSAGGTFGATATGRNILEALTTLRRDLDSQFQKWRAARVLGDPFDQLAA